MRRPRLSQPARPSSQHFALHRTTANGPVLCHPARPLGIIPAVPRGAHGRFATLPSDGCRPRPDRTALRSSGRGRAPSDGRPTTTPGGPLEHHPFYYYFLFFLLFLFLFSALTYLSTSICLIHQYCILVVDCRPPRPGRHQGSPSPPSTRQSRPSSCSPHLGRTGRLELVGFPAF